MSARLNDIQRQLGLARRRLEEWTRRIAALRERIEQGGAPPPGAEPQAQVPDAAVPLFHGLGLGDGALDDVELNFEVLDTEDPGSRRTMKLFAAGAELAELEASLRLGLCTGVVVDRAAAALENVGTARALVTALAGLVEGPIFVEVAAVGGGADAASLVSAARQLAASAGVFVARIPFGPEGLAAIRACAAARITTNAVGCATPVEAIEAARAGARWVSPAWDLPAEGPARGALFEPLRRIVAALRLFDVPTEVLVGPAPDRSVLVDVAFSGAHAGSARAVALQEIARRRADGLAPVAGKASAGA